MNALVCTTVYEDTRCIHFDTSTYFNSESFREVGKHGESVNMMNALHDLNHVVKSKHGEHGSILPHGRRTSKAHGPFVWVFLCSVHPGLRDEGLAEALAAGLLRPHGVVATNFLPHVDLARGPASTLLSHLGCGLGKCTKQY